MAHNRDPCANENQKETKEGGGRKKEEWVTLNSTCRAHLGHCPRTFFQKIFFLIQSVDHEIEIQIFEEIHFFFKLYSHRIYLYTKLYVR